MQRQIGYQRNRTKEFQQQKQKLRSYNSQNTLRINKLPPKWVDKMEETRDTIQKVGILSQEIDKLKNTKDIGPKASFNEQVVQSKLDQALQVKFQVQQMIRDIEENMMVMENDDCVNDTEFKIKQNARMCLAISLKEVTPQLRNYQNQMLMQVQLERPKQQNNLQVDFEQEYIETLILDRNDRIKNLGEKIKKMNELFKEMNRIVIEQGTLLDRIDFNIDQTLQRVIKGKSQLKQADEKQQTSDRAQKCICILVGLNIFVAFLFVIKHTIL